MGRRVEGKVEQRKAEEIEKEGKGREEAVHELNTGRAWVGEWGEKGLREKQGREQEKRMRKAQAAP